MMKSKLVVPPLLACAAAALWLVPQRRTIEEIETRRDLLRKAVDDHNHSATDPSLAKIATEKAARDAGPIDWKQLARQFDSLQRNGATTDLQGLLRVQHRIAAMSNDELLAAIREVTALNLSDNARRLLLQQLINPLLRKDPPAALASLAEFLDESSGVVAENLTRPLKQWARTDPAAAGTWLDEQVRSGKLDTPRLSGTSASRMVLEGALLESLFSSDPDALATRLSSMPETQRSSLLRGYAANLVNPGTETAYIKLVRSQLSPATQKDALLQPVTALRDFDEVRVYLARADATAEERAGAAEQTGTRALLLSSAKQPVDREAIDLMRANAESIAPGSADQATATALNALVYNEKLTFDQSADYALQYHDAGSSDDLLFNFLEKSRSRISGNEAKIRELAAEISDESRRNQILDRLK